jgi:hypothetical protein
VPLDRFHQKLNKLRTKIIVAAFKSEVVKAQNAAVPLAEAFRPKS